MTDSLTIWTYDWVPQGPRGHECLLRVGSRRSRAVGLAASLVKV